MKAMILREYGSNAEFQPADLPQPAVKPGHVLVRVAATSVNTVDTMIRQMGSDLPLSPALPALLGMDCPRRPNFDPPCRSNTDPGMDAGRKAAGCG